MSRYRPLVYKPDRRDGSLPIAGGHIEPWAYVHDLLLRLHADDSSLEEMLPDRWAAAHPEAILDHRLENCA